MSVLIEILECDPIIEKIYKKAKGPCLKINKKIIDFLKCKEITIYIKNNTVYIKRCDIDTTKRYNITYTRKIGLDDVYYNYIGKYTLEENENEEFQLLPYIEKKGE